MVNVQKDDLKSNSLVFAGPFLGELGWEISHWAPHVRWLRQQYQGRYIIAASYPGRHPLYYGFVNEFYPLPDWFLKERYEVDCYEALAPEKTYGKLLKHFESRYKEKGFSNIIATRTPRGFNHVLRNMNQALFDNLKASPPATKACDDLVEKHGNKPCVIIFAREVMRETFLNIKHNRPEKVNIMNPLPSRNWPRSHWETLFEMLYEKYNNQITFVIGGRKIGNCLYNKAQYDGVIDLTEVGIANSLDITIAFLQRALCSISSQSGPTHLSLQAGCPSFIYGHEYMRHAADDNPFQTDVVFFETALQNYNDSPQLLFNDTSVYIDALLKKTPAQETPGKLKVPIQVNMDAIDAESFDKKIEENKEAVKDLVKIPITDIKQIGMIGVFDVEGSTNIPFAKAFNDLNYPVLKFNYRSALQQIGAEARDKKIIDLSKNSDLLIFCKGNGIDPEVYNECAKNCTTCFFMMDSTQHLANQDFFEYAKNAHFSVVTTMAMKQALENNGAEKVYHILQGVDPDEFYHMKHPDSSTKIDIVFVGTASEKRIKVLHLIQEWGYSADAYGTGFGMFVLREDFNKACAKARICLAINNTDQDQDSFSDRILRYLATKSFVVTEYSKGLEKYFTNGEELVWFKNETELKNILDNFLRKDTLNLKKEIAEAGYQKVINNYTWKHVAQKILSIATSKEAKSGEEKT